MKIAGIIAEYNPFHNGHAHHIRQVRWQSGCDYVVVCMDGSFTQRGEAACLDKWSRARIALECGADAVFELPALWALQPADGFARGGVAILGGLGCDCLGFGSECSDLDLIHKLAQLRREEPEDLSRNIQAALAEGKSHARARGEALAEHLGVDAQLLNSPNLTLAAEYLNAMEQQNLPMEPVAVERIGAYHDSGLHAFASASAIRRAIAEGRIEEAIACIPEVAGEAMKWAGDMHAPDDLLLHTLRNMTREQLARLPGVAEGLECRVKRCAREASGQEELIELLKCKRYTRARLMRLCAHALLGITQQMVDAHPLPEYARLLGMRADAGPLLAELKRRSRLPIHSDAVAMKDLDVFRLECRATDVRALLCNDPAERRSGQEFTKRFVRV